jgi:hypothetical protein
MNNRRQSERINIPLEIVLESTSGKRDSRISDLGLGGCFVDSIANVVDGEVLKIILRLPGGQELKLAGAVVYIYPGFGFGLRFINPTIEQQDWLEQVIVAHGGKPSRQRRPIGNTENEPENAGGLIRNEQNTLKTENKSYNEFEDFLQDLLDDFEGESKPVQTKRDFKEGYSYTSEIALS